VSQARPARRCGVTCPECVWRRYGRAMTAVSLLTRFKLRSTWTGVANTLFAIGVVLLFVPLYSNAARSNYVWAVALGVLAAAVFSWLTAAHSARVPPEPEPSPVVGPEWKFRGPERVSPRARSTGHRASGTLVPSNPPASSSEGASVHELTVIGNPEYREYIRYAEQCTRMAEQKSDPRTQESYRELARRWRDLAKQLAATEGATK
jgi:hypothetical protein